MNWREVLEAGEIDAEPPEGLDVNAAWTAFQTLQDVLLLRGFVLIKDVTPAEFNRGFAPRAKITSEPYFEVKALNADKDERIVLSFIPRGDSQAKAQKNIVSKVISRYSVDSKGTNLLLEPGESATENKEGAHRFILVADREIDIVTPHPIQFEFFSFLDLSVNIFRHCYVPMHGVVADKAAEFVLRMLRVTREKLPTILESDITSRLLGARPGDLVYIHRFEPIVTGVVSSVPYMRLVVTSDKYGKYTRKGKKGK